ncbi:hypothetical protein JI57_03415 [Psychromonas sp. PRT-SC03]|nr:hypothetical protein JI57_03415 [Psychromonas sp. PRT-SC03]
MRFSLYLLLSGLLLLISACSTSTQPLQIKPNTNSFISVPGDYFQGQLNFIGGKTYFTPCETEDLFLVSDDVQIKKTYAQQGDLKDSSLYVELSGEIRFTDQYLQMGIRIDKIYYLTKNNVFLQCAKHADSFTFTAQGDSPSWRLMINDNNIFLASKASNQSYKIRKQQQISEHKTYIEADNDKKQKLTLTYQESPCYSLKNKEYWGYNVQIKTPWDNLTGCAKISVPKHNTELKGTYKSTQYSNPIKLTFTAKHHVIFTQGDIIKTGFWKSKPSHQVVIMLIKQGSIALQEEYILSHFQQQLRVISINKNNKISNLTNPFIFKRIIKQINIATNEHGAPKKIHPQKKLDNKVQNALLRYFKTQDSELKDIRFSVIKYDLNNDGIKDAIIVLDKCKNNNVCDMLIFKGSKDTYLFNSRFFSVQTPVYIAQEQHYLWHSFLFKINKQGYRVDFDGQNYDPEIKQLSQMQMQKIPAPTVLFTNNAPMYWQKIEK